jgi:hypothetical protein
VGFNKADEIDRDDQQSGERDWLKIAHSVASKYGRNEERDSYVNKKQKGVPSRPPKNHRKSRRQWRQ